MCGPPSQPQEMPPLLLPWMRLALTLLAQPLLLHLQASTCLAQPQQRPAAPQQAQPHPAQTHLPLILLGVHLAPVQREQAAAQCRTHLGGQPATARALSLPQLHRPAGLCQRTCLLHQAHPPLAGWVLGYPPSSSRPHPLDRCHLLSHSLALALLEDPKGVLSRPRLVHSRLRLVRSRQDRQQGVVLGCRSSLACSEVKACRVVLVARRLRLEVPRIHLAQTVALAHLLPRCSVSSMLNVWVFLMHTY